MNKETIEKAAINYENSFKEPIGTESVDFIAGAKWQAERMYSEIQMKKFAFDYATQNEKYGMPEFTIDELFEQFKKK